MYRYHVVDTPDLTKLTAALVASNGTEQFEVMDTDGTRRWVTIKVEGLFDARFGDNIADQAGPLPAGLLETSNSWVVIGSLAGRAPLDEPLELPFASYEAEMAANQKGTVTASYQVFVSCDPRRGFGVIGMYPHDRSDNVDADKPFYEKTLQDWVYGDGTWL